MLARSLRFVLLIFCMGAPVVALSSPMQQLSRPAFYRVSYDAVAMPDKLPDMGLLGLAYLWQFEHGWYAGVSGFAAVEGNQGGLFTMGVSAGHRKYFAKHWFLDAGLSLGGGGGKSSQRLVGGGLMVRQHFGLGYRLKLAQLELDYSHINFPYGAIHSQGFAFALNVPFHFDYLPPGANNFVFTKQDISTVDPVYVAVLSKNYYQPKQVAGVDGKPLGKHIHLLGIDVSQQLYQHWLVSLQMAGAYSGIKNGYMDALIGVGYLQPVLPRVSLVYALHVGAGGGSNVNTGSGFLYQPSLALWYQLSQHYHLALQGGYISSGTGNLKAWMLNLGLLYQFNFLQSQGTLPYHGLAMAEQWRVRVLDQVYFSPQRETGSVRSNIQLINLAFDHFFNHSVYASGQAVFAYQGHHAGSYAVGLFGLGVQSPVLLHYFSPYIEVLVGAAGGGGLAIKQGEVWQPSVGIQTSLTRAVALQTSVGKIMALHGKLNATVLNAGLSFSFAKLSGS